MMSFFGPAAIVGGVPSWAAVAGSELAIAVLSTGAFAMGLSDIASGIAKRLAEDDDGNRDPMADEDPFGGEPTDEFGGGQFGEDAFDDDLDDDGFDDFDDWEGDDEFGGLEGAGGGASGLEPRMEELEDEVANISSTVSTVRSESQAINESVEDMEDNIRQLLDIYEMVTRGVNPFVDDVGGGGTDGSFGLFEDDGEEEFDDLDPEVADADPDSFFDDEFAGDEADDGPADPFAAEEESFDDEPEQTIEETGDAVDGSAGTPDGPDGSTEEDDDGKTFEQLKSEYESGGMDWQDDAGSSDAEVDGGEDSDAADGEAGEPSGSAQEPAQAADGAESVASTDGGAEGSDGGSGKPYLEVLPEGYATELLVIEWLSYLRSRSSTSEALRAIRYYETIDWIGAPAAEALQEYLTGIADGAADTAPRDGTQLTVDHHTHSLRYIGRLGGADVEVERLDWPSPTRSKARLERGEQRGIQR